jgi:hypothetical protein
MKRALALLLSLGCSGEEEIIRVKPVLSVCPARESTAEACDRPIDLGELPIGAPHARSVFVFNRGEGPLIVSLVGGTEVTSAAEVPFTVPAGAASELPMTVTPSKLGAGSAVLSIESDDERSPHAIELLYVGLPEAAPRIELCAGGACGTDIAFDFGVVRRTQIESAVIEVKNVGDAPLEIAAVELRGDAPELSLATPTRPGTLDPDARAEVVVLYQPNDGMADHIEVVFVTDDPASPEARVSIDGSSAANLPPIADARQVDTATTSIAVAVEELVVLDGSASQDPEGDPLLFAWTVTAPDRSTAQLDSSDAGLVTFAPDVAGSYRVELVVTDSLGQPSPAAVVLIEARPRFAFRAQLRWQGGGDLDLHLVTEAGALFGAEDCFFDNPMPDLGVAGTIDDPQLRSDVEAPPGGEEIVLEVPAPGLYRLYVHYFEEGGLGPADATVDVIFDDSSQPAFSATSSLMTTCSLWYVGDLSFPPAQFVASSAPAADLCR